MSSLSSVKLDDSVIQFLDTVKIIGATLDSSFTMGPHTKVTSKSCYYHIRSFRQIRSSMDHTMAISVASALVSLALARVVTQQSSVSPLTFTELLKQLHWLPHRMANPI